VNEDALSVEVLDQRIKTLVLRDDVKARCALPARKRAEIEGNVEVQRVRSSCF